MKHSLILVLVVLGTFISPAPAQIPPKGTVIRPVGTEKQTVVVPDQFLRRWDPITIFFARPVGKKAGSPENTPEAFFTLEPAHPTAAQWINPETLQIRPVDPWKALERYRLRVGERTISLATLMPPPIASDPPSGSVGLPSISRITLVFPLEMDPAVLARMLSIEISTLPGISDTPEQSIDSNGFSVKQIRDDSNTTWTYAIVLEEPIRDGMSVILRFRLSLDDGAETSVAPIRLSTMTEFRITEAGSLRTRYPITAEGSFYGRERAIRGQGERKLAIVFSAPPGEITPMAGRALVRITPAVDRLEYRVSGNSLIVGGDFQSETLYRIRLEPAPITDTHGRNLNLEHPSEFFLWFPPETPYLKWKESSGIVERFGPRMVPLEGRGSGKMDLRILPIDPLNRGFWPFPPTGIVTDDAERPPGPGEEALPHTDADAPGKWEIRKRLKNLGSPTYSGLVTLPFRRGGSAASFGLDIGRLLDEKIPSKAPGHFLLGLRELDTGTRRQWMRIQLTDLALTTLEEPGRTTVFVTSLSNAMPVAGARVSIDGICRGDWIENLFSGTTDAVGRLVFNLEPLRYCSPTRITVVSDDDVLVLDCQDPPEKFSSGTWSTDTSVWLRDLFSYQRETIGPERYDRVSFFRTERPVYRPGEVVHILGYLRLRDVGVFKPTDLVHIELVIDGPGDLEWRRPLSLDGVGSFNFDFEEKNIPTGKYTVRIEGREEIEGELWVSKTRSFRIEAYRIPRFEVILDAPERAALDRPFKVFLGARYYAGGRASDLPVSWRVTQFPLSWSPPDLEGFFFSSDSRFSPTPRFESTGKLEREDRTDSEGASVLEIDPGIEPTAQPRTYVVEATVTGADGQTVTSTRKVDTVPPFILGLAVPRYLEPGAPLDARIIVVDGKGSPISDLELELSLIERQWHSYLRASDFTTGTARYITDVVETDVLNRKISSRSEPFTVPLEIARSGVYVVRLSARDRLGRTQSVSVDLYAAGEEAVGWAKPPEKTLRVTTDKKKYSPGDTAVFVVESPFKTARVLVAVETPEGAVEHWFDVIGGTGNFELPVHPEWAPGIPVHFILMRGRLGTGGPIEGTTLDLGRPTTLAATKWIEVDPRANRLVIDLKAPTTALPGSRVGIEISITDPDGTPLSGRAALWLVDRAVLALGKEHPLDPLGGLLRKFSSMLGIRDTRNLVFGWIPFGKSPGGGEGARKKGLVDRVTVRRNFKPVAYYNPAIDIGPDGKASIDFTLPDNLTDFAIRATAASGWTRFGSADGILSVRLPVIIQPALPRFIRSGDSFDAAAVTRVVDGTGGAGHIEIRVNPDRDHSEQTDIDIELDPTKPRRIGTTVTAPPTDPGKTTDTLVIEAAVLRDSDHASDGFRSNLPLLPDRKPFHRAKTALLDDAGPVEFEPLGNDIRPGSISRRLIFSPRISILKMAGALETLRRYPHDCTEQRIARARGYLAARRFRKLLDFGGGQEELDRAVEETLERLPAVTDESGLVSFWPGCCLSVSLTAWVVMFEEEARLSGYDIDQELLNSHARALEGALRSDSSALNRNFRYIERSWALAALARIGRADPSYLAELARRAQYLDLEATALVLQTLSVDPAGVPAEKVQRFIDKLSGGIITRLRKGREVYGGLQEDSSLAGPEILASECRTLAEIIRALNKADPKNARLSLMIRALAGMGTGLGWGSTNADASALLALSDVLEKHPEGGPWVIAVDSGNGETTVRIDESSPMGMIEVPDGGKISLRMISGNGRIAVMERCAWTPQAPGAEATSEAHGFVVTREALLLQPGDAPPVRIDLSGGGQELDLQPGQIIEEHLRVINPEQRYWVAVTIPFAAGMEVLNPALATAPPEAEPANRPTLEPAASFIGDDRASFYYNDLPSGTFDLYIRTKAVTPGEFNQPPARAETMYDPSVWGSGAGALIRIAGKPGEASD